MKKGGKMIKKEKSPLDMILSVYDNLHDAEKKLRILLLEIKLKWLT